MQKENKVIVKLNCFPGPCRTGENRGSRFFVSDRRSSVRSKIGRCRITTFRQNTNFTSGLHLTYNDVGFTLIELLVVVLIIGILASVALPQYTLAVNKSRFANLRSMAQPYIKAMEAYHLANGEWPTNFDELSVDAPAGMSISNHANPPAQCAYNNEIYCCVQQESGSWSTTAYCGRKDYSFMYVYLLVDATHTNIQEKDLCVSKANNPQAEKLCKSFGGTKVLSGAGMWSPDRAKGGYNYYSMQM